ncbi:hypothetical protein BGX23_008122 [Mortierella sp. AD031]|nr:hypothetical protein BGX23_008122 [Mortierella sp. AD031]
MRPQTILRPTRVNPLSLPFLALLLITTTSLAEATITCQSPSGRTQAGSPISIQWSDDGSFPRNEDVYSADATVVCTSSGAQITQISPISNGQSWTIPRGILQDCEGGTLQVEISGTRYGFPPFLKFKFEAKCGDLVVEAAPSPTTTTTTTTTTSAATTTTTQAAATTTTAVATATTPLTGTTPTVSSLTLSATGTATTIVNGTLVRLPPGATATGASNPDAIPNAGPSSPGDQSSSSSSSSDPPSPGKGGPSKVALGALGAVAGLVAIAALVFGFVLVKRRQRRRACEEHWMDHNYSGSSMSDKPGYAYSGSADHAFTGPGAGGTAGLSYLEVDDQRDGHTTANPEIRSSTSSTYQTQSSHSYVIPQPAPPADKSQHEMSTIPTRPARAYQGDFETDFPRDDGRERDATLDHGYEFTQDFAENFDTNNNRQLSMRASSQLPSDLAYFARLRDAEWPIPPTTTTTTRHSQSQPQSQAEAEAARTIHQATGPRSSPTQMPHLIPLARSLSHSGAHKYDLDGLTDPHHPSPAGAAEGLQFLDVNWTSDGDNISSATTTTPTNSAADQYRLLSM